MNVYLHPVPFLDPIPLLLPLGKEGGGGIGGLPFFVSNDKLPFFSER